MCRVVHQQSQNLLLHFISHKNYSLTIPAEVLKQGIPYTSTDCLRNILEIYLREKKSKSLLTFDWDFKFLTTLKPSQIFSTPSTLPLLPRDTVTSFSQLVGDIIPAVIKKKPGALQALLQVGRSKQPERTHQNFQCIGVHQPFQSMSVPETLGEALPHPEIRLLHPYMRCKKLARVANTGGALKALTSNGMLNASECYEILKRLHPEGPELEPPPGLFPLQ